MDDRLALARAALAASPHAAALSTVRSLGEAPLRQQDLLPVLGPLAPLLPHGGLVRGHLVGCRGEAAMSLALALAAGPTAAGSWAAVLGLPSVGVLAAAELGVALERTMFVAAPPPDQWAVVLGAVVDGADVVITAAPGRSVPAAEIRRVHSRLQSRGGVLVLVGEPGLLTPDLALTCDVLGWEGIGDGHGHLASRRVRVEVGGRRAGRPRRHDLVLPGPDGGVHAVRTVHAAEPGALPWSAAESA